MASLLIAANGKDYVVEVHLDTSGFIVPVASVVTDSGCLDTGGHTMPRMTPGEARWLGRQLLQAADRMDRTER